MGFRTNSRGGRHIAEQLRAARILRVADSPRSGSHTDDGSSHPILSKEERRADNGLECFIRGTFDGRSRVRQARADSEERSHSVHQELNV